jgi:hypothetical protein
MVTRISYSGFSTLIFLFQCLLSVNNLTAAHDNFSEALPQYYRNQMGFLLAEIEVHSSYSLT